MRTCIRNLFWMAQDVRDLLWPSQLTRTVTTHADALAEAEAEVDHLEPGTPYLSWATPDVPVTHPRSVTGAGPSEVSAPPPTEAPSEGLFSTSLLLDQGAIYAYKLAEDEADEDVARLYRIDAAAMRDRAAAFQAIENTP
ncbi:hypothetical protein [Mycolicibacterium gilvum]|uniref:hypothetical protein n=1 Tax=Mycolicibacterium gilvum TaxID=1804 RepID=UPI0040461488